MKRSILSLLLTSLMLFLSLHLFGQVEKQESEPHIMVTEEGVEYEIVAWDTRTVYDPMRYSYFEWRTPIFESEKTKDIYPVPVTDFDQVPVFTKACLDAESPVACTNEKLAEFIQMNLVEYPEEALENRQEGLEYVTVILDENGKFANHLSVLSKDKPCDGCAQKAINLIHKTQDQWQPAILDGKPVKVQLTIPVRFDLRNVPNK